MEGSILDLEFLYELGFISKFGVGVLSLVAFLGVMIPQLINIVNADKLEVLFWNPWKKLVKELYYVFIIGGFLSGVFIYFIFANFTFAMENIKISSNTEILGQHYNESIVGNITLVFLILMLGTLALLIASVVIYGVKKIIGKFKKSAKDEEFEFKIFGWKKFLISQDKYKKNLIGIGVYLGFLWSIGFNWLIAFSIFIKLNRSEEVEVIEEVRIAIVAIIVINLMIAILSRMYMKSDNNGYFTVNMFMTDYRINSITDNEKVKLKNMSTDEYMIVNYDDILKKKIIYRKS